MKHKPSYYRARLDLIQHYLDLLPEPERDDPDYKKKAMPRTLLKSGVIPPGLSLLNGKTEEQCVKEQMKKVNYSDEPLTFVELTTWNTWFVIHPGKVCGKEKYTTSREFPVTIEGTQQDIEKTIRKNIENDHQNKTRVHRQEPGRKKEPVTPLQNKKTSPRPAATNRILQKDEKIKTSEKKFRDRNYTPKDGWEKNLIKARDYASHLIDHTEINRLIRIGKLDWTYTKSIVNLINSYLADKDKQSGLTDREWLELEAMALELESETLPGLAGL